MNKSLIVSCLFVILFFQYSRYAFSQTDGGDKLRRQISKEQDPESKADQLIKLAFYFPENDSEAERCLQEAYDISKKTGYHSGMIFGQYYEVLQLTRLGRYDEAIERSKHCINEMDSMHVIQYLYWFPLSGIRTLYNLAGKQEEKLVYYREKADYYQRYGPVENLAVCYHGIAGYYHHLANYEKAIQFYTRAWDSFKSFDPKACANEKQSIGSEYLVWGNLDKAEEYLKSALKDQIKLNEVGNCFFCYHQLGDLYFKKQNYQQALEYYFKGKQYCVVPEFKAINLVSCAVVYLQMNSNDVARIYLDSADKIRYKEKLGIFYTNGVLEIDYAFYKYYVASGNEKRALQYLQAAMSEATLSGYLPIVLKYSHEFHSFLLNQGDSLQALRYLIRYQSLQDSINTINTRTRLVNFESDNQASQKEKDIKLLEIQKSTQRTYYLIGMAFLVVIILGAISRSRYIRRNEKEKLTSKFKSQLAHVESKALRAQMNPHFIFNCLNSINSYIIDKEHDRASEYLIKFSRLIRLILENSSSETIPIEKELEALKLYTDLESARFDNKFKCEHYIDKCVNIRNIMIPPMLLQPFVENAIWHGLMHKKSTGTIKLIIKNSGPKLLKISIIDDGIGRDKAAELNSKSGTHKSFGIEITAHRIEMMNKLYSTGTQMNIIDMKDDEGLASGTRVDLIIPY